MVNKPRVVKPKRTGDKAKLSDKILTDRGKEGVSSFKKVLTSLFKPSTRKPKKVIKPKPKVEERQVDLDNISEKSLNKNTPMVRVKPRTQRPLKATKNQARGNPNPRPKPKSKLDREIELAEKEHESAVSRGEPNSLTGKQTPVRAPKGFSYTKPVLYDRQKESKKDIEVIEIKDEKVVKRSVVLDSVKDINDVSFFERIGLVNYFNALESGKFDERAAREEYKRNTERLQRENSLKYMLMEIGERNLNYAEYNEITVLVDPSLKEELEKCIHSRLLTSYEFDITERNPILVDMNVDPIVVKMKLKVIM